ncbi:MAG: glycosyl hydrolase, partial [Candidatus Hydrogenedentales bacterium]
QWQIVAVAKESPERSVDPMDPASGQKVIERFFQPFADHCPGDTGRALNYFFHDELTFGVSGWLWTERFAAEFEKRKGYDIVPMLPALFIDIGPKTPKIRLDFSDVMVSLTEESFFRPVFEWHWKRGITFACDPGSRGGNPLEFGDYFRAIRWYVAPGHDTPGGKADLHKDKVSSSIAHLYQRPRVWLEGYHSLGWGATPATIFDSTNKNFLYGANLLNLHGLYYSTHGSYWEWAPPCYHFRMPYWDHMGSFFKYFERLSYLLSQGAHQCDVAMLYPTAPLEAGMGDGAVQNAFKTGDDLYLGHGIDFDFIDFESLERAKIQDKQLRVAGEAYRVLLLPSMRAVRQSTLDKALEFYRAGGMVAATGPLPEASDRAGRDDADLDAAVRELFGVTAGEARDGKTAPPQTNAAGGLGAAFAENTALAETITRSIPRDFVPEGNAQVLHRKIGTRDIYMVMGAEKNSECFFRAKGAVELWDPWTGTSRRVYTYSPSDGGTRVRMPLDRDDAQLIVFNPGSRNEIIEKTDLDDVTGVSSANGKLVVTGYARTAGEKTAVVRQGSQTLTLRGEASAPPDPIPVEGLWEVELKPTMDNRWGDFRLPASNALIGAEARQFMYSAETSPNPGWEAPNVDDSAWKKVVCSFGTRFWKLGPLPDSASALDEQIPHLAAVDPSLPVTLDGKEYPWHPYNFSMRWGVEGDPGPQGYHGLKEMISDDFLVLGTPKRMDTAITYEKEPQGTRYYLWTSANAPRDADALMRTGDLKPTAVWINGIRVEDLSAKVSLKAGSNPVVLRYDAVGRAHFVLELTDAPAGATALPLAMRWYTAPGVVPFDAKPQEQQPAGWYRFVSPPGLRAMTIVARGEVQAWADGVPMAVTPGEVRLDGAVEYAAAVAQVSPLAAKVAIRVAQERGCYGGAALPDPVALACDLGQMPAGDWSQLGVLADYSGGMWYRKAVALTQEQTRGRVTLDLGRVSATAEVLINGQSAGVKLTPPWTVDISALVKPGDNRIEILVYNTLANHYATIPTRYKGSLESGLLG